MQDKKYMLRAMDLAKRGLGKVSPNPLVGCVIVHNDRIIGEGFHKVFGGPHAEVNAIADVEDESLLSESTAYVTLEPCSHHGKTPPCADLLIEKQVKRVVIGCLDPFPQVSGRGVKKLEEAGIEVETGLLEEECKELNRRFFIFQEKHRPYVILKWAQTRDGFLARTDYDSKWISNDFSRQMVHLWRGQEDAILVGKNTVLHDDPALTVRDTAGSHPIRIVLDARKELSNQNQVFDGSVRTLVFNTKEDAKHHNLEWIRVDDIHPVIVLNKLYELSIQSVIIEGGAKTLNSFIEANCWDEARIFIAKRAFKEGICAPRIHGEMIVNEPIFEDKLTIQRNNSI